MFIQTFQISLSKMIHMKLKACILLLALFLFKDFIALSQSLYTARGYWEESTKKTYQTIKQKADKNETLSPEEQDYITDYDVYLATYYAKLSEKEKQTYESMKSTWDKELSKTSIQQADPNDFDFRGRDRFFNFIYGSPLHMQLQLLP